MLDPEAHWSLADGLKGVYNQKRVEDFIGKGYLGSIAAFDIFMDQNITTHTKGVATGTPLINGASQSYTTPTSAQLTANTYDLITGRLDELDHGYCQSWRRVHDCWCTRSIR